MKENFSKRVQLIIKNAKEEAIRLGHSYVGSEHLLLGIIKESSGLSIKILEIYDCNILDIKSMIEDMIKSSGGTLTLGHLPFTRRSERILRNSYNEATALGSSLADDEPLLLMTPIDVAISKAQFLFFVPILRKTGQDSKIEITSKFKEAVSNLKKGSSLVYCLGTGFGGNSENMSLLEHVTGNKVGKNTSYYYYPLSPNNELPNYVGANSTKSDEKLQALLSNEKKLEFIGIPSS